MDSCDAFAEVYSRYGASVHFLAGRVFDAGHADEVVQDILLHSGANRRATTPNADL